MLIGFDLDKLFIDTPPFIPDVIIEKLYIKKTKGSLVYRIPTRKEQLIRIASHFPLFRPPIKNNMKYLQHLAKTNHELYLISSRFGFLRHTTNGIVKKHNLADLFKELHFNYENKQPHIFKNEVIKKLKLDTFVDDDLYLLKYIASKNNNTKLYWYNKKHNKKISKHITAITNLENILKER